jgi:hypothetical protein
MFSRVLVSLIAFATVPSNAARAQTRDSEPDSMPPKSVRISGVVDVPLLDSGIPGAQLPVISVMVNGKGPYRFGVETGAGFVAISPDFAAKAGLARVGGRDDAPEYAVDSITFGGASFRELKVTALPRSAHGVDAVLGLPFFRNVTFTIDYPANRFRIALDTLPAVNGKDVIAITRVGPFWGIPITLAGDAFTGVIDTRSSTALSLTPSVAAKLPFAGELQIIGRSSGAGIPGADVRAGQLAGDARIGAYTVLRPEIAVRELPAGFPEGPLVGSRVLSNFVVSLDQRSHRVRLVRQGATTIELPTMRLPQPAAGGRQSAPSAAPNVAAIADYVGSYGERTISAADGKLYLQRTGGPRLELVPAGRDAFTIANIPQAKIEFGRDQQGRVNEIRVLNRDGRWERQSRGQTP